MNIKKITLALCPSVLGLFAVGASAQSINIGSATVPEVSGGAAAVTVSFDNEGTSVGAYNTVFSYDDTILDNDPVSSTARCVVDPGSSTVSVARFSADSLPLPTEDLCVVTFNVTAGTAVGAYPLAHDPSPASTAFADLVLTPLDGTVNDGAINVVAEGPPTITIPTAPITLSGVFGTTQTSNVAVTVTDGGGNNPGDTASYSCTAPAGISAAPLSGGPIVNGATLPDIVVSCTLGAAEVSGTIACNATNTAGSDVDFDIPVTCEAGTMAPPVLAPTPADGSTITVGTAAPGAVGTGSLVVTPTGGAGVDPATVTCSAATAPLTVNPTTLVSILPGAGAASFAVGCPLTQAPQEFPAGVTCTGTDGNGDFTWTFDVACPAGVVAPTFVPASSLWSKLALFGIFAALGMLVLGLRRNH